jgi:hypothetical protein
VSFGVTGSSGGSVWVAGWLVFCFVLFDCFGLKFFVSFSLELFGLFSGSFHQKPSSLSPSRGSNGFELSGGFVGIRCASFVSGWPVVPFFSEA